MLMKYILLLYSPGRTRLTSLELQTLKIPNVMICDTMVGSLFQNHKIHAVGESKSEVCRNTDEVDRSMNSCWRGQDSEKW
jgi:hypothetical protein